MFPKRQRGSFPALKLIDPSQLSSDFCFLENCVIKRNNGYYRFQDIEYFMDLFHVCTMVKASLNFEIGCYILCGMLANAILNERHTLCYILHFYDCGISHTCDCTFTPFAPVGKGGTWVPLDLSPVPPLFIHTLTASAPWRRHKVVRSGSPIMFHITCT